VQHQGGNWIATLLPFAIIAVVIALRIRTMRRERPLKLGTLWVVPVVYLLLAGSILVAAPPPELGWALAAIGLAIGLVVGWYRGRLIQIECNGDGELRQRASPLAMLLLLALVVLKLGARQVFGETAATQPGSQAMLLTDAFIGFALGLLSATRAEIYLRAKRLLSAA
jgi:hypothetical protein